ncbi:MAG: 5'-3' exonuclease [Candidatus Nanopelagicales bacterium]
MSPVLLLDLPSLYYRAFYALPTSISDSRGKPINAIRGSLTTIAQLVDKYKPRRIIAAIDESWRPNWRVELLSEYKSHRLAADKKNELAPEELLGQIPDLIHVLKLLQIAVVGIQDFEADDCLASLSNLEENSIIVTSDRDLLQLINKKNQTALYLLSDKSQPLWDYERFKEVYGFEPEQYLDYAVLRGDPSDGLKGVSKVGEKTAAKFIKEFQTIENLINNLSTNPRKKLSVAEENIISSVSYIQKARQVTSLNKNLKLKIQVKPMEIEKLNKFAAARNITKQVNEILRLIHD